MLSKFIPPSLLLLLQTPSVSSLTAPLCGTGLPPPLCGLTLVLDCNSFLASVRSLPSLDAQKPASQEAYLCLSASAEFSHGNWGMCGGIFSYVEAASGLQGTGPPYTLMPWLGALSA